MQDWAAVAAVLIGIVVALCGVGEQVERGLLSLRASLLSHPASGRIALVEIDARSFADQPRWPWPRSLYGQAVQALARSGATLAAFDIDVSAASSTAEDAAFAQAIAASSMPVALPVFAQARSQGDDRLLDNAPIAPLREHALLASVNVEPEADGTVRRFPYGARIAGTPFPSMAALLAGAAGVIDHSFQIDPSIDPNTLPRFSFEDLLAGRIPRGALKGRAVIIGATAIELGDRYPVVRHGVLPGALIQALAAETLAEHGVRWQSGPLAALLLAAAGVWAVRRLRSGARTILLFLQAAVLLALPVASDMLRLPELKTAPALALTGAGALLFAATSAVAALRCARLTDARSGLPNARALQEALGRDTPWRSVLTVRMGSTSDLLSVAGDEGVALAMVKWAERLRLATGTEVYRTDVDALAWPLALGSRDEALSVEVARFANLLRAPVEVTGRFLDLPCAFGSADLEDGGERVIVDSRLAAGRALARGATWDIHHSDRSVESATKLTLTSDFDGALAAGDIWVAYQPKLDIASGVITGAEALVRWRHPERGAISPEVFIPLLEAGGRMADLTLYVLSTVLEDLERWSREAPHLCVAVNISALLPGDPHFMRDLSKLLANSTIRASRLTAEVTESAALANVEQAAQALEDLAALGVRISIDDYGTGQSTLSYLRLLPASEIKIDKSFVLDMCSNRNGQAMVRSSIDLAHQLGMKVVAEGVETSETLDLLRSYGCDTAQGWYVGRPVEIGILINTITAAKAA